MGSSNITELQIIFWIGYSALVSPFGCPLNPVGLTAPEHLPRDELAGPIPTIRCHETGSSGNMFSCVVGSSAPFSGLLWKL